VFPGGTEAPQALRRGRNLGRVGFDAHIVFFPGVAGHPCPTLRAISLSLQRDPAHNGKGGSRPARRARGSGGRFGIPKPSPKAEARPRGRAVSKEQLSDWHGRTDV